MDCVIGLFSQNRSRNLYHVSKYLRFERKIPIGFNSFSSFFVLFVLSP